VEVSQDQASLGRDSTNPEAPLANPVVPPPTPVPLVDLDSEWEPERSVQTAKPEGVDGNQTSAETHVPVLQDKTEESVPVAAQPGPRLDVPPESPGGAVVGPLNEAPKAVSAPPKPSVPAPPPLPARRRVVGPSPQVAGSATLPATDPLDVRPSLRPLRREQTGDFQRTGHPVRDRLMAKAIEASKQDGQDRAPDTQTSTPSGLSGMDQELERLAGPRQQLLSRPVRLGNAVLSPGATLLGVTLVGLAAIASLFLILVQLAPRNPSDNPLATTVTNPGALVSTTAAIPDAINLPPPVPPPERTKEPGPWRIGAAEAGQKVVRGTIGSNPFLKAIQEAGIETSQAYRVYGALKEHKDFDHCRSKDEFVALISRADKRVVAFEYVVSKEEIYQAREDSAGKLVGKPLDLKVNKHRVQGSILVANGGFGVAAKDAGLEPTIAVVINRALSGHTNTSQFRPGDRLRVVAQEVTVLGEFHRYAGIEALEYLPVEGTPTRIYYHAAKRQYYDAKGRAPGEGGWRSPVRGAPITSKFNPQRLHPILKKKMPHNGTDFGAPAGTPIYAASYGKITKLGNYGANGNYIAIAHDNGYETGYSHLSRFEPGLKVGDQVKRSQVIGYVGSTGRSTGPHLHFSARKDGAYIDAETLHLDALTVLPSAERAAFMGVKEKYDGLLEAVALPPPLPPQLIAAAPSVASESEMHGDEAEDEQEGASAAVVQPPLSTSQPIAALVQPVPPALAASPAASAVVQPATQTVLPAAGGAFFLTDKELLSAQPAVDDGEVDE
jgi:murein DD-endopeptidase MepM/ murein hydrolase activator NlpD